MNAERLASIALACAIGVGMAAALVAWWSEPAVVLAEGVRG